MRTLIFSDIHGNLEALNAVLKFARRRHIDRYACLGDLVGYGASPEETIEKIRSLSPLHVVRGNHDKAVSGQDSIETFNPIAAAAIHWTRAAVSANNLEFLGSLIRGPLDVGGEFIICHGAPFDEDYYIFGEFDAIEAFEYLSGSLGFFGHTHFPFIYSLRDGLVEGQPVADGIEDIRLDPNTAYLINPGSVGQPRDRDSRAACAIHDAESRTVKFFRLEYDLEETQRKIRKAGLPAALAERLALGI